MDDRRKALITTLMIYTGIGLMIEDHTPDGHPQTHLHLALFLLGCILLFAGIKRLCRRAYGVDRGKVNSRD